MKLKITIGVFVVVLLGLFLLARVIHANGQASNDYIKTEEALLNENSNEDSELPSANRNIAPESDLETSVGNDSIYEICKPAPLSGVSEQIVKKKAYIVSYNKDTRIPNWVAWHLTADHTDGDVKRFGGYFEDEDVPEPRATNEDYRGSGWSKGHMCPAGDNKWDEDAMRESNLLTNICPQHITLNSGLWNRIEQDCRKWAKKYGEVYIVCGPVLLNREHESIGKNKVVVPEAFFKVILCLQGKPKAIGFIVRNNEGKKKKDQFINTVDDVERITGIDFFPVLPDSIEDVVEATANIKEW